MKTLAKTLLRLDGLSHVLAWTRDPVLACKDPAALHMVELPRLRLRFEAKADGPGGKVRVVRICRLVCIVQGASTTYVLDNESTPRNSCSSLADYRTYLEGFVEFH